MKYGKSRSALITVSILILLVIFYMGTMELAQLSLADFLEHRNQNKEPVPPWKQRAVELTLLHKINWSCVIDSKITPWQLAEAWVTPRQVTNSEHNKQLGCVLNAMRTLKIEHADNGAKGTQLKMALTLRDNQRVVFKPMFYGRDYVMVGTPYAGKDRHNAEIAAFHLNRILGLNKVPIVVGRSIDLESEIRPVAHSNLLSTFYYKEGNTCFYGRCMYCKGPETGVCANRTIMEGSITLWLPEGYKLGKAIRHPWARTYNPNHPAKWETDSNYCETVRMTRPYEEPPRLLDLIDIAVFDFLIGNADRHHYETLEYGKDSMVVALDNGKSFGTPYSDELSILAPLYQCCTIRKTTYDRLQVLKDGVLSEVLYNILLDEPLAPLLTTSHYIAIDRRLNALLKTIHGCISKTMSAQSVLVSDGYT